MPLTVIEEIFQKLAQRPRRLGCAESLSGGLVAAALCSRPGSSAWFEGGVVAYSNRLKMELLEVPAQVLERYGAVSRDCALAMAQGARRHLGVDLAVATTGIAGPDGGNAEKPVGLVWLAVASTEGATAERRLFSGDRQAVCSATVRAALELLSAVL